jgi:hypothetical protein
MTQVLSVLLIVVGLAMLARTIALGGGQGILLGVLFCALGAGRLYLSRRA